MIWSYEARHADERRLLRTAHVGAPVIVTDLHAHIVAVNRDWTIMCQYTAQEAFGQTPKLLQGPLTDGEAARSFSMQLRGGTPCFAALVNYKQDGTAFVNHLYGYVLGDLLVAETYAEHPLERDAEAGALVAVVLPPL